MKKKLQPGDNASETELIDDGQSALLTRDRVVKSGLVRRVAPAWDALKADPSRALSLDKVRARLAVAYAKAR